MDCFVGVITGELCHKQDSRKVPTEVINMCDLSEDDQVLLKLRVSKEINNICHYHKYKYLTAYHHTFGKKCCDPLHIHKKPVKNGLKKILLGHLSKPTNQPADLVPGKSLCPSCTIKLFVHKSTPENKSNEDDIEFKPEQELVDCKTLETVDEVCGSLNISPVHKIMKLNKDQRHGALMKKTEKISSAVKRKLEESFSENLEEGTPDDSSLLKNEYEELINKLKENA